MYFGRCRPPRSIQCRDTRETTLRFPAKELTTRTQTVDQQSIWIVRFDRLFYIFFFLKTNISRISYYITNNMAHSAYLFTSRFTFVQYFDITIGNNVCDRTKYILASRYHSSKQLFKPRFPKTFLPPDTDKCDNNY